MLSKLLKSYVFVFSLIFTGFFANASPLYQQYTAHEDSQGNVYLTLPKQFILIHSSISIPLFIYPENGLIKVYKDSSGNWKTVEITQREFESVELKGANYDIEYSDSNGDGTPELILRSRLVGGGYFVLFGLTPAQTPSVTAHNVNIGDDPTPIYAQKNGVTPDDVALITPVLSSTTFAPALDGQAGVSGGAASYQIPMTLPPGRAGMQPSVSISYSSRAGDGIAGVGFSLNASEGISRCGSTVAQDGMTKGVTFTGNDKLCLNGQRLILVSGSYGATGSEYRYEIDNNTIVKQLGGGYSSTQSYFEVTAPSGKKVFFGQNAQSMVVPEGLSSPLSWLITTEQDVSGNNLIRYSYQAFGAGEILLSKINYTGTASAQGDREVRFAYEDKNKFSTSYIVGGKTRQTQRLKNITTYYKNSRVREYTLTYKASAATARDLLAQVKVCGYQPSTQCSRPTIFDWEEASTHYQLEQLATNQGNDLVPSSIMSDPTRYAPRGDMNGDGVRDWPTYFVDAEGNEQGRNTYEQPMCYRNVVTMQNTCHSPDFNKDGLTDTWRVVNDTMQIGYSYSGQPNDWSHTANTNVSLKKTTSALGAINYTVADISDYNGDGWPDIVVHEASNYTSGFTGNYNVDGDIVIYLHTKSTSAPYTTRQHLYSLVGSESMQYAGDLNSDGLPDFVVNDISNRLEFSPRMKKLLLTQVSSAGAISFITKTPSFPNNAPTTLVDNFSLLVDVNSDGLSDWVGTKDTVTQNLYLRINQGDGTFGPLKSLNFALEEREVGVPNGGEFDVIFTPKYANAIKQMDVDSDGRVELLIPDQRLVEGCTKAYADGRLKPFCGDEIYEPVTQTSVSGENISISLFNIPTKFDTSIYTYKALHFVEDKNGNYSVEYKATDLVGRADSIVVDGLGKGLPDLVFSYLSDTSSVYTKTPSSGIMSGKAKGKVYFNRNYGATPKSSPATDDFRAIDMLVSSDNGVGIKSTWHYQPLSSNQSTDFYQADFTDVVDDDHFHFASSMYAVAKFEQSNPLGTNNALSYQYRGAVYNTEGRGFRGFKQIIETNESLGVKTQTDFKQKFPYSSLVKHQRQTEVGHSEPYLTIDNQWVLNTSHSYANTYMVYNALSTKRTYDINDLSENVSTSTEKIEEVDEFGNVLEKTTSIVDVYGTYSTKVDSAFDATTSWPHKLSSSTTSRSVVHTSLNPTAHANANNTKTVTTNIVSYDEAHRKPNAITVGAGSTALSQSACQAQSLNGCVTTLSTYNTYGLATQVETKGGVKTSANGGITQQTRVVNTTYSNDGTTQSLDGYFPYKVTQYANSTALVTTTTYNAATGTLASAIDANGITTSSSYDGLHRTLSTSVPGQPTLYNRYLLPDSNAPTHAVMMLKTSQAGNPTQYQYLNNQGKALREATESFDGSLIFVDTGYDALGRMTEQSSPYMPYGTVNNTPYYTRYGNYDILGRAGSKQNLATEVSDSFSTTYQYTGLTTTITTTVNDGHDLVLSRTYNSLNQLMSTTDAIGGDTRYAYDGAGNPIVIEDAARNSIYAYYDDLGRKLWVRDPNQGLTAFTYNDFGELIQELDANNDSIFYQLDNLGRMAQRVSKEGNATFVWDTLKKGLLTSESSPGYGKSYTYDNLTRVTQTTTTLDNVPYVVKTSFDNNYGRVKSLTYPNGLTIAYQYNARGYLTHETNAKSGYVYRAVTAQDAWGNVISADIANQKVKEQKSYSATTGQMLSTKAVHAGSNAVRQHLIYSQYDSYGNLKAMQNLADNLNTTETYAYDKLHRLSSSSIQTSGLTATLNYGYDAVGNFLRKSDYSANHNNAYQYQLGTNKLASIELKDGTVNRYGYDNKGNQTHKNNQREVTYNTFNKPVLIDRNGASSQLYYDANWMRYKQVRSKAGVTTTTYYIDKLYEVETTQNSTAKTTSYVSDVVILVEQASNAGQVSTIRFAHKDRLGSTTSFTDHNGQLVGLRSFDPFGKPKLGDGGLLSDFGLSARLNNNLLDTSYATQRGFTDHEHLDDVELIHMNGRVYDYNLGRFLSVDPFIQAPGNSQSINPYSYIMNNPLSGTDPTGYIGCAEGDTCKQTTTTKNHYKKKKGSRIKEKSGSTTTTTTTNQDGETVSSVSVTMMNDGSFSTSIVSFNNGAISQTSAAKGNYKTGTSSSITVDMMSQKEISQGSSDTETQQNSRATSLIDSDGSVYSARIRQISAVTPEGAWGLVKGVQGEGSGYTAWAESGGQRSIMHHPMLNIGLLGVEGFLTQITQRAIMRIAASKSYTALRLQATFNGINSGLSKTQADKFKYEMRAACFGFVLGCAAKFSPGTVPKYVAKSPIALRNLVNYLHRINQTERPIMLQGVSKKAQK